MSNTLKIERVAISSLQLDPSNARKHDSKNLDAIKGSLAKFGQQKPIVVDNKNIVLAGNGTLEAAKALGWDKIDVVRTELEGSEAIAYAIADNRASELAAWDEDVLTKTLQGLKDENFDLGAIGFDSDYLEDLLSVGGGLSDDGDYTKKIKSPIYHPTGEKPSISSLLDREKTENLIKKIEASHVEPAIKDFLRSAAFRHNVFNYQLIAEYYAHAPKEVQELFEESALVIIDFEKAIENGFVVLSKDLAKTFEDAHA